jgi:hypothetical protein
MIKKAITLSALFGCSMTKSIYDMTKSDVVVYSRLNFEKQVTKNRDKGISIVHFFRKDGKSLPNVYPKLISYYRWSIKR